MRDLLGRALTRSLREPGEPCTKSMEVSESRMERVNYKSQGFSLVVTCCVDVDNFAVQTTRGYWSVTSQFHLGFRAMHKMYTHWLCQCVSGARGLSVSSGQNNDACSLKPCRLIVQRLCELIFISWDVRVQILISFQTYFSLHKTPFSDF